MSQFVPKAKLKIHNPRDIKTLEDAQAEVAELHKTLGSWKREITSDFLNASRTNQGASNITVVVGSSSGGGSGGGGITGALPIAGSYAVPTVADTSVVFSTAIGTSYALFVFYQDGTGQFNMVNVAQTDQTSTGFTIRAIDMPGVGTYYYAAIPYR